MLLFDREKCIDICLKNDNKYVALAVDDLIKDFQRVSECSVRPNLVSEESEWCIVVEKNSRNTAKPMSDEGFAIICEGNKIRITADGYLGTMWAIYTISERFLGVEPCYLFNDLKTVKQNKVCIPDGKIFERPNGFGFRGVFINDEDLLTAWKDSSGMRHIDSLFYNTTVPEEVMDMVVETMLRLKFNLIIPATFLDIDNPPEKLLADCVAKRGIYLSQHHCEPLGVTSFTFKNYCEKYGKTGSYSYEQSPKLLEEVWTFYAQKWAEYDNVVWQIGLRGLGEDRPLWQDDDPSEEQLIEGAKAISRAYEKQREIIDKATDGRAKYFTSTLWMEGSTLVEKGYLKFPSDVIAVFADTSPTQLFGEEYEKVRREKDMKYGIYYHLQYYGCGPHIVPQTGLKKLYFNLKRAFDKGDNSYIIMNASNVREFVFELKAYSQIVLDTANFSSDRYLDEYCSMYGNFKADMKRAIIDYFDSFPEIDSSYLQYHLSKYFNYDKSKQPDGITNFVLKEGSIILYGRRLAFNFYIDQFKDEAEVPIIKAYYLGIKSALERDRSFIDVFEKASVGCDENLNLHTKIKWLLSAKTLDWLYKWFINVYEAKLSYVACEQKKTLEHLHEACRNLENILEFRKCAEYGEFENWYRGEVKMNIPEVIGYTRKLLGYSIFY